MEIGILSSAKKGFRWDARLVEEIEKSGNNARIIDYTKTFIGITEAGRVLYSDQKRLKPINVDAVIPRIGRLVDMGRAVLLLLESQGKYTTTSSEAIPRASNKLMTQILLDQARIPTPYSISPTGKTTKNLRAAFRMIEPDPDKKVIIKNLRGSHGKGVRIGKDLMSAVSIADGNERPYMIQEFIESEEADSLSADIRIIVVDGVAIAAMKRRSTNKHEFRSNLAKGAKGEPYDPTPREVELAIEATSVLGLIVSGVDLMKSVRGSLVDEVNSNPGFGIERYTDANVAKAYVDLVLKNTVELLS